MKERGKKEKEKEGMRKARKPNRGEKSDLSHAREEVY